MRRIARCGHSCGVSTPSRIRRLAVAAGTLAASVLVLAGCATSAGSAPSGGSGAALGSSWPDPPAGEVTGQGTVLDTGGSAELCLGPVAESYPPQCSGIPLEGWTWDGVEGSESSGDVTWGAYAITGTYDGETLKVTQPPIMLALYDPLMPPDPTGGKDGVTDDSALEEIQEGLPGALGAQYLGSWPERGYLWVQVVWDDGTLQSGADAEYGEGVVVIQSAWRAVG